MKQTQPECSGKPKYISSVSFVYWCVFSFFKSVEFYIGYKWILIIYIYIYIEHCIYGNLNSVFAVTKHVKLKVFMCLVLWLLWVLVCSRAGAHCVWLCICVYLWSQAPQMRTMLSQDPPGAFPDGLQNSCPCMNLHRCQPRVCLHGAQDWGLGTSLSPRTKEQLWRSSQCFWTSCTFTKLGLYICYFQKLVRV